MPGQGVDPKDLRVSDAERAHVMSLLEKATGRGLITLAEFSDRSSTVIHARTRGELNAVLLDLPGLAIAGRSLGQAMPEIAGGATPGNMPGMGQPGQMPPPPAGAHPHGTWTINGKAMLLSADDTHDHRREPPLLTLKRGTTAIFALKNDTVFDHPIHLHGHTFRVLSRNGKKLATPLLTDTVLMTQQEAAELAFVGKRAAEAALGKPVNYGSRPEPFAGARAWVLPSTSGAARGFWSIEPWRQLAAAASSRR